MTTPPVPDADPTPPAQAPLRPAMARVVVAAGRTTVSVDGLADTTTGRPADAATPFHLCSMSKTLTAVVALRLARRGELDLDADVRTVLDLETLGPWPAPTVRRLLSHHGGVLDPPDAFTPAPVPAPPTADVVAGRTAHHPGPVRVTAPPGGGFAYSDAGYCLVERVVEVVTGRAFADVLHGEVVAPLGLTSTAAWTGQAPGSVGARGDVLARVVGTACAGHHADGRRVDGVRVHYAGPAACGVWASAEDVAVLVGDLLRAWRGTDAVLLDAQDGTRMVADEHGDGAGLGVFVGGTRVMTQGWGVGFQSKVLADHGADRAVAVLLARDPGAPQPDSVVGRTVAALLG